MVELFDLAISFAFSFKFLAGIAIGAGFHRFWSRNAIKAYKGLKGRL